MESWNPTANAPTRIREVSLTGPQTYPSRVTVKQQWFKRHLDYTGKKSVY